MVDVGPFQNIVNVGWPTAPEGQEATLAHLDIFLRPFFGPVRCTVIVNLRPMGTESIPGYCANTAANNSNYNPKAYGDADAPDLPDPFINDIGVNHAQPESVALGPDFTNRVDLPTQTLFDDNFLCSSSTWHSDSFPSIVNYWDTSGLPLFLVQGGYYNVFLNLIKLREIGSTIQFVVFTYNTVGASDDTQTVEYEYRTYYGAGIDDFALHAFWGELDNPLDKEVGSPVMDNMLMPNWVNSPYRYQKTIFTVDTFTGQILETEVDLVT